MPGLVRGNLVRILSLVAVVALAPFVGSAPAPFAGSAAAPLVGGVAAPFLAGAPAAFMGAAPAAAATSSAGWQLLDYHPNSCVTTRGSTRYYGVYISGSWGDEIDVGAADLPAGASSWSSYAPIPPGSSDGVYSLANVAVAFPANLPLGTVTVTVWATDGDSAQSVPWTLRVQSRCGY